MADFQASDFPNITTLSNELLCHIIQFLPLKEILALAMQCQKLASAVHMYFQLCKSLDFSQENIFGYMPSTITDDHMHYLLRKCPRLEMVYGLHPLKVERRRLRKRSALTVPGIIEALCLCPHLKGVETCDLRLLEALLQHLPQLEIIGHFRNRHGIFPPHASQRLKLQPYPQISSLHLIGVEVPELTAMPHLKHLSLQCVRFTKFQPFRAFIALNLRSFIMKNCMGPPVPLRYLSLIIALSSSQFLTRLELVRVPLPGALFQRAVEDSYRNHGFVNLKTLIISGCKGVLESDIGYLMIVASRNLESLSIQPSLTKDSLFVSLSFARCHFTKLKHLNLGYVDESHSFGEWSNDALLTFGMAMVPDTPSSLTDSGMRVISKLFPNVQSLSVANCPHLMGVEGWSPTGTQMWKELKDIILQHCHCLRLFSFALFLSQLPKIETVILKDMFKEPPKGCSHVGLSAGTGLGMSSAVVSNQDEQITVPGYRRDREYHGDDPLENEEMDRDFVEVDDLFLQAEENEPEIMDAQGALFGDENRLDNDAINVNQENNGIENDEELNVAIENSGRSRNVDEVVVHIDGRNQKKAMLQYDDYAKPSTSKAADFANDFYRIKSEPSDASSSSFLIPQSENSKNNFKSSDSNNQLSIPSHNKEKPKYQSKKSKAVIKKAPEMFCQCDNPANDKDEMNEFANGEDLNFDMKKSSKGKAINLKRKNVNIGNDETLSQSGLSAKPSTSKVISNVKENNGIVNGGKLNSAAGKSGSDKKINKEVIHIDGRGEKKAVLQYDVYAKPSTSKAADNENVYLLKSELPDSCASSSSLPISQSENSKHNLNSSAPNKQLIISSHNKGKRKHQTTDLKTVVKEVPASSFDHPKSSGDVISIDCIDTSPVSKKSKCVPLAQYDDLSDLERKNREISNTNDVSLQLHKAIETKESLVFDSSQPSTSRAGCHLDNSELNDSSNFARQPHLEVKNGHGNFMNPSSANKRYTNSSTENSGCKLKSYSQQKNVSSENMQLNSDRNLIEKNSIEQSSSSNRSDNSSNVTSTLYKGPITRNMKVMLNESSKCNEPCTSKKKVVTYKETRSYRYKNANLDDKKMVHNSFVSSTVKNEIPHSFNTNTEGPLTRNRERMSSARTCVIVSQGTQATSSDIRRSLRRQVSNTSPRNVTDKAKKSHRRERGTPRKEKSAARNRISLTERSNRIVDSKKSKPCMKDKSTSSSDPLLEDDAVQTLRVVSSSLLSLTIVSCGISDIIIDHCKPISHIEVQACRILKKIRLHYCPYLTRLNISQCPKIDLSDLASEALNLKSLLPLLVYYEPCMQEYNYIDAEQAIFTTATLDHGVILLHDFSCNPSEKVQASGRENLFNWLELLRRILKVNSDYGDLPERELTHQTPSSNSEFPWGHLQIRRIYGQKQFSKLPNSTRSNFQILTNNPLLSAVYELDHDKEETAHIPNPQSLGYSTDTDLSSLSRVLMSDIFEWKESNMPWHGGLTGFYIQVNEVD